MSTRRLPPYGKTVRPLAGRQLYICVGWPPVRKRPRCDHMVLPDNHPEQYEWPVMGCDVYVSASHGLISEDTAKRIFEVLANDGAKTVVIFGTRYDDNGKLAGFHCWPESLLAVAL